MCSVFAGMWFELQVIAATSFLYTQVAFSFFTISLHVLKYDGQVQVKLCVTVLWFPWGNPPPPSHLQGSELMLVMRCPGTSMHGAGNHLMLYQGGHCFSKTS